MTPHAVLPSYNSIPRMGVGELYPLFSWLSTADPRGSVRQLVTGEGSVVMLRRRTTSVKGYACRSRAVSCGESEVPAGIGFKKTRARLHTPRASVNIIGMVYWFIMVTAQSLLTVS